LAEKTKELLSEEQATWLKEFAASLNDGLMGVNNIYTPSLLNRNLQRLNNNQLVPDYDKLVKAINNAINSADTLQAYQEWMELAEITFKRLIEYYVNILSLDLSYTCINVRDKKEYSSAKYKKDKRAVEDFLTSFNYREEFRKVIKQILKTETAFMWLRNNNDSSKPAYTLQLMPQNMCMITGAWEKGMLYDFNLNYFLQAGVDIDGYDSVFKEYMRNAFGSENINDYKPTNPLNDRTGTFAFWTQTSPIYKHNGLPSGAWVFKMDTSTFNNVPFLSSLMRDAILNIPVKKLQYDKDAQSAYAYLVGEIGMLKNNEANATQFDPRMLGTLLSIVKQAVGKHIAVGAMPTNENKWYQYVDNNTTMAETQVKSVLAQGASASRILYSSDKMSQEEIRNAILADYNFMKKIYGQFNNFLDFYVNQLTKHYKFKFYFDGSNYGFEREWRKDGLMRLAENGIVLNDTAFASAYGYDPVMFSYMMQETKADGSWLSNVSLLQSIYTMPAGATADSSSDNSSGGLKVDTAAITQKGGNRSNYNVEGARYIHTGKPGRPRRAEVTTDSRDYDNSNV
jgi:hypothetical protein